jgi:hypothetical protein
MTYLLFFLSIGLATALALVSKKLQQQNRNRKVDRQRMEELNRRYAEPISREDAIRQLDIQIISLKEQIKQISQQVQSDEQELSTKLSLLREDATRQLDIEIIGLKEQIKQLNQQIKQLNQQAQSDEQELSTKISLLRTKLQGLEEQEFFESFGFYDSKYNFQESVIYKQRLDQIRAEQKQIIKDKKAAVCLTEWSVGGSVKEGKKMTDNFIKLVLRAFNGECDAGSVSLLR